MRNMLLGLVTVIALSSLALAGCASPEAPADNTIAVTPRANSVVFGEFSAHISPKNRTMTITRLSGPRAYGPNLEPQSIDNLNLFQDGNDGSGPPSSAELVSNNCVDGYPGSSTFQCDVTMRHFWARSFANVFAQVTSIKDDMGQPMSGHSGANDYGGDTFGLDGSLGIWQHSADPVGNPGVLAAAAAAPQNAGTTTWIFENPDDADTNLTFAVWGSKSFANYTFSFPNLGYMDACTGGTVVAAPTPNKKNIVMPFDFTLYDLNSTNANIALNGQLTIGGVALIASGPVALPTPSAPSPGLFVFWDALKYNAGGKMCYQTIGASPNRQFVVEWRGMNFSSGAGSSPASNLNFEVYLFEGSGEIDTVYNSMVGGATSGGRETGTSATVGVQGTAAAKGTITTSEHDVGDYGTGEAWSYIPSPM